MIPYNEHISHEVRMKPSRNKVSRVIRKSEPRRTGRSVPAFVVGRLALLGPDGSPRVDLSGRAGRGVLATTTVALGPYHVGRDVLVCFADSDQRRPVVVGVLQNQAEMKAAAEKPQLDAIVDGERIVMTGKKEVILTCGKASIALTADGKIVVRGAKILSTAEGLHRIRGATVEMN
jgi:hypothetical protein